MLPRGAPGLHPGLHHRGTGITGGIVHHDQLQLRLRLSCGAVERCLNAMGIVEQAHHHRRLGRWLALPAVELLQGRRGAILRQSEGLTGQFTAQLLRREGGLQGEGRGGQRPQSRQGRIAGCWVLDPHQLGCAISRRRQPTSLGQGCRWAGADQLRPAR